MWTFLWTLFLFIRFAVGLNLTVPDPISLNVSTEVNWTTDGNDPEKWNLRLVVNGKNTGLVMANVDRHGEPFGTAKIRVHDTGVFQLVAVGPRPFRPIGRSNSFNVKASNNGSAPGITSTLDPSPASAIYQTSLASQPGNAWNNAPTTSIAPVSASTKPDGPNTTLVIGAAIGGAVLVVCGIVLLVIIQKRRRSAKVQRNFVFNRELMFQSRPSAYDEWTIRSVELEKGIRGTSPQIFVTKTTTRDTDL